MRVYLWCNLVPLQKKKFISTIPWHTHDRVLNNCSSDLKKRNEIKRTNKEPSCLDFGIKIFFSVDVVVCDVPQSQSKTLCTANSLCRSTYMTLIAEYFHRLPYTTQYVGGSTAILRRLDRPQFRCQIFLFGIVLLHTYLDTLICDNILSVCVSVSLKFH